jgi:hypothetical protein
MVQLLVQLLLLELLVLEVVLVELTLLHAMMIPTILLLNVKLDTNGMLQHMYAILLSQLLIKVQEPVLRLMLPLVWMTT